MEAAPRFELGMRLLQSPALPLGYAAISNQYYSLHFHLEQPLSYFILMKNLKHIMTFDIP